MTPRVLVLAVLLAPLWGCPPSAYQCQDAQDCEGGFTCLAGSCQRVCSVNNPCPGGETCDVANGVCLAGNAAVDGGATTSSGGASSSAAGSGGGASSSGVVSSGRSSSAPGSTAATSRPGGNSSSGTSASAGGGSSSNSATGATSVAVGSSSGLASSQASSSAGKSSSALGGSSSAPVDPCRDGNGVIQEGVMCDDGNVCTQNDTCDAAGVCQGGTSPCMGNTFHPVCNPVDGSCGCAVDMTCGTGGLCFGGRCLVTTTAAITNCGDDGVQENFSNGEVYTNQDSILLSDADDFMGLRFTGTGIPANSTVFHAVPVVVVGPYNRDVREDWALVMDPNTPPLEEQDGNISGRMPRSASLHWDVTPPPGPASAPDFAADVQALVALPAWDPATGAIMFVADRFTDSGDIRYFMCDDNEGRRPRLYLQYAPP